MGHEHCVREERNGHASNADASFQAVKPPRAVTRV